MEILRFSRLMLEKEGHGSGDTTTPLEHAHDKNSYKNVPVPIREGTETKSVFPGERQPCIQLSEGC